MSKTTLIIGGLVVAGVGYYAYTKWKSSAAASAASAVTMGAPPMRILGPSEEARRSMSLLGADIGIVN